ncbi:MAG: hypothetical protein HY070_10770 [Chloroflexi bacterium]|nr:hypothetical protein [Chloroflexota bacterium]
MAQTRIRRERVLATRGEVVSAIGARVDPMDVVAFSESGNVRPIPLARYLRVPESALAKFVQKRAGDRVQARDVIAAKPEFLGMLQRIYRAPGVGRIAALQGSWLAFDLESRVELKALYRGTVVNVMPRLGVVVEATGALMQAAWGGGGEGSGPLKKMVHESGDILSDELIDVSARGLILIAGAGVTEKTLERMAQERAAGLIVGGLKPRWKTLIEELHLPTILTEGWGEQRMAQPIFDLLVAHAGEDTTLNPAARPEIFIPTLATQTASAPSAPAPTLIAEIGARVRALAAPERGMIGKIARVADAPQVLESGVRAWGGEIEFESGTRAFVAWENLELID